MLRLNTTIEKQLNFELQIAGVVDYDQVECFFKIIIDDVHYGFPGKVLRDSIIVTLPPLNKIIGKKIKEGDEAEIKLELIADGHYLTAWSDRAKLSNPLVVEAKIKDPSYIKKPKFETKLVSEEGEEKQVSIIKEKEVDESEEMTSKIIQGITDMFSSRFEKIESQIQKENNIDVKKSDKTKLTESKNIEKVLDKTINKINETKTKKKITLDEFKKRLTKEDIYKYMNKTGTKNKKIQNIIYEQASALAESSEPIEILKHVIKVINKKK